MPGITILPANLATLIVESFLYGLLLLLFISTIYFLATRRTLAGTNQTTKHHFKSVVFLGVTALFIVVTIHWSFVIYQAFFAFIHLGTNATEDAFYADLAQQPEVLKSVLLFIAVLLGDALVTYRLWIIWGQSRHIIILPILALLGVTISAVGDILKITKWEPEVRGAAFINEEKPWTGTAFALSLLANLYSTGFIIYRIWKVTKVKSASESRLTWFVSILVESAALQTLWLIFAAMTLFSRSDLDFIATDNFPAILGISNTLIHARVGLGWSQGAGVEHKPHPPAKHASDVV
ncbi:hypothetical protein DFH08DRAFT_125811 [Mycena albidolilacea]|uniref:Uncharacterized protein n=1 Tax=Mycena albidolilacea TaxID=1033008 RepID=A0AAD7A5F3_9AGAR|nr:hypothetical protein DFH08DRAFT_125811 [Mycena albidolilacea]